MPVSEIKELRILPPLAIGRFGSSNDPMDNYIVVANETSPPELRGFQPAETLIVNQETGEITEARMPADIPPKFRDATGKIRPVAPFFEVWARFDDDDFLQPLTIAHLTDLQLAPSDVQWQVSAANYKAFRRTGDQRDKINSVLAAFGDHTVKPLRGTSANFKNGKFISFGTIQYLKPTAAFPEIRLRFTPPAGKVYGVTDGDPNIADDVYNAGQGRWDGHRDGMPGTPPFTNPGGIYANNGNGISLGYLDDACDGIIKCSVGGFAAIARFSSGPPVFAPDSFPVRTVADELEQMLLGSSVTESISVEEFSDIIRRALDTIWHLNTEFMNRSGMAAHDAGTYERAGEPIFQPVTRAAYPLVRFFHQEILSRLEGFKSDSGSQEFKDAVFALRRVISMLRMPENVGDLSNSGRRKMPAMMRNSDGLHLALTKRQINKLRKALQQFDPSIGQTSLPEQNMLNFIRANAAASGMHAGIPVGGGQTLSQLFANPPALLNYLRTSVAKGDFVPEVNGQPLVVPGNPDASAFVALISNPDHPMHDPFSTLDPTLNKTGITIVREWISSLT
jgi:hypothetical protein